MPSAPSRRVVDETVPGLTELPTCREGPDEDDWGAFVGCWRSTARTHGHTKGVVNDDSRGRDEVGQLTEVCIAGRGRLDALESLGATSAARALPLLSLSCAAPPTVSSLTRSMAGWRTRFPDDDEPS